MLFCVNSVPSQDTTYVDVLDLIESKGVQWVNQIPPLKEDTKATRKGWFKRLLLGKSDVMTLQKPVQVIGFDDAECVVFDQGNGTLFIAKENQIEVPKFLRKANSYYPSLVGACRLPDQRILFTDSKLNKIFVLSADRRQVSELNVELELTQPTGIAFNEINSQIWVVETGNHQIKIFDQNGLAVKTIGDRGTGKGQFNYPTSLWIDNNGHAYVVDALNYRIQIFDAEGQFISMFGENGNGTGYFASLKGIATDSYGHIYVVDALFHTVQIFDINGNYLYQFGTQGSRTEEFWMPSGIFIDDRDFIYIADSYNSRIQVFELNYSQ